jgi:hypothetical protein
MAKVGDGPTVTETSPREMTRKIERYLGYLQFCIQKKDRAMSRLGVIENVASKNRLGNEVIFPKKKLAPRSRGRTT